MSFRGLANRTPVIEIPRNPSRGSTTTYYRESWWSRFSDGVADIGNWFADHAEKVLGIVSIIAIVLLVISCVGYVIGVWVKEGFFMALLAAVLAGVVGVIGWYVISIVVVIGVNLFMYGFRFIFWNGWTLMITLVIILSITGFNIYEHHRIMHSSASTEVVQLSTETYECTASSLNIRSAASTQASVIGALKKGQTVEVYEVQDGFAHISLDGQEGYVSIRYLKKQ